MLSDVNVIRFGLAHILQRSLHYLGLKGIDIFTCILFINIFFCSFFSREH